MRKSSIAIGDDLWEAGWKRAGLVGYKSFSSYVAGLIRSDIIRNPSHEQAMKIATMTGINRDRIDREMLEHCIRQSTLPVTTREESERDNVISMLSHREPAHKAVAREERRMAQ